MHKLKNELLIRSYVKDCCGSTNNFFTKLFCRVLYVVFIWLTFLLFYYCLFLLIDVDFKIFLSKVKYAIFCNLLTIVSLSRVV